MRLTTLEPSLFLPSSTDVVADSIAYLSFNNVSSFNNKSIFSERMLDTRNISLSTIETPTNNDYEMFWRFSNAYRPIHGWLSTFVCLFGIPSNMLNIIVLTRPNLINSPTNLILTALAVSDLLTMLSSIVFSVYYYIVHVEKAPDHPHPDRDTKFWTHFSNIHVMASVTFHSISIWLTVYLACFRYIYIASSSPASLKSLGKPNNNNNIKNNSKINGKNNNNISSRGSVQYKENNLVYFFRRFLIRCRTYNFTLCGVLSVCLFCVIFCFPAYIYPAVKEQVYIDPESNSSSISKNSLVNISEPVRYTYSVGESDLNTNTNGLVFKILFHSQAIFGKFVPCLLLVTFSSLLIHSLIIINRNNKKLNKYSKSTTPSQPTIQPLLSNNKNNSSCSLIKEIEGQADNATTVKKDKFLRIRSANDLHFEIKRERIGTVLSEKGKNIQRRLSEIKQISKLFNNSNGLNNDQQQQGTTSNVKTADAATLTTFNNTKSKGKVKRNKAKENLRTTLMLTIVCVLFLITEFPQSILISLSIIKGNIFYQNVYMPLGDLFDILALVNNSINFLLYCTMSRAFRNTFYNIIVNMWLCRLFRKHCLSNGDETTNEQGGPRANNKPGNKNNASNPHINTGNFSLFTAYNTHHITPIPSPNNKTSSQVSQNNVKIDINNNIEKSKDLNEIVRADENEGEQEALLTPCQDKTNKNEKINNNNKNNIAMFSKTGKNVMFVNNFEENNYNDMYDEADEDAEI
jgi:hypothetical protein